LYLLDCSFVSLLKVFLVYTKFLLLHSLSFQSHPIVLLYFGYVLLPKISMILVTVQASDRNQSVNIPLLAVFQDKLHDVQCYLAPILSVEMSAFFCSFPPRTSQVTSTQ